MNWPLLDLPATLANCYIFWALPRRNIEQLQPSTSIEKQRQPDEVEEDARAEPAQLLPLSVAQRVEPLQRDDDDADRQLPKVVVLLMGKVLLSLLHLLEPPLRRGVRINYKVVKDISSCFVSAPFQFCVMREKIEVENTALMAVGQLHLGTTLQPHTTPVFLEFYERP